MKNKTKSLIIKYTTALVIGAALALLTLELNDFGGASKLAERYRALTNAFSIPGVIFIMVGFLVLVSADGFFDIISYGLARFGRALVPFSKKSDESFYDYKTRKNGERFTGYSFIFITGAVFCAIAAVFLILFYSAYK